MSVVYTSGVLSAEDLDHFDTFGFVVRRGLLAAGEVDELERELDRELDRVYGGFDGVARQWALMSTGHTPAFAALLEDPRFFGLADEVLRGETLGAACDGSRYVGDTTWHGDTTGPAQWGVKFLFYFEPLDALTGAPRVIPGSHREPYYGQVRDYLRRAGADSRSVPSMVVEVEPGDVLAYDMRLQHASFGGRAGRRGGSVFFYHDPQTPEQESALRAQDRLTRTHIRAFHRCASNHDRVDPSRRSPLVDPESAEGASALRRRWTERLRSLGFLDPVTVPLGDRDRLPHGPDDA